MDVNLSKAVRSNLLSLQNTATMMGKTQERLATGLKVNSALDNPTNFFTASGLKSRAGDLGQLMDSVSNAIQTIQAADKGISAMTKLVESAQATARQALQTSALVTQDVTTPGAVTAEASVSSASTIDTVAAAAASGVGSVDSIDGSALASTMFASGDSFDVTINGETMSFQLYDSAATDADPTGGGVTGLDIDFSTATIDDVLAAIEGAVQTNDFGGVTPNDFTIAVDGDGAVAFDMGSTDDQNVTFAGSIATDVGLENTFTATEASDLLADADGEELSITLGTGDDAVTQSITIASADHGDAAALAQAINDLDMGVTATATDGVLSITGSDGQSVTLGGDAAATLGLSTTQADATVEPDVTAPAEVANPKRAELVDQYNELLSQIDDLAKDASFNGVNLLNGDDLQVIFNEDGSSKLDITGVTFNSAGLGLAELDGDAFDTNDGINVVLADLKSGIEDLRTQASKFGSNLSVVETRQNFTKDMVNVLETGAANLTLADTNEEAANLLALQTRQQLSSTALSMASQSDQAVLRLF